VVRHGARAPLIKTEGEWPFPAAAQMLTPSGMRQRYLLGKYHRYKLDGPFGFPTNITDVDYKYLNVMSTNYYRTITSGYSELLGMTNDGFIHDRLLITSE